MTASRPRLTICAALLISALAAPAAAQDGLTGAYLSAKTAFSERDYIAAAEYYEEVLDLDEQAPRAMENAAAAHLAMGDMDATIAMAERLAQADRDSSAARMARLVERLDAEDYDAAIDLLEGDGGILPVIDGLVSGWAHLGAGRTDAAHAAFEQLSERGLGQIADYHAALAHALEGDFEAADALMSGGDDDPLHFTPRAIIAHAKVLGARDRGEEAIELLDRNFGADAPPEVGALTARLDAGEPISFDMLEHPIDGAAEAFFDVATALERELEPQEVLLYMRVAEYLRPDHADALMATAQLLSGIDRHDLAAEAFARVTSDHPSYHIAEIGRAEALHRGGDLDAALELLDELAETHDEISAVHEARGDILRREERWDDASAAYDRAIDRIASPDRRHWVVFYTRAITHERGDRWDAAEADFRKALELEPDQPDVLNYLGYSLVEKGRDLEEARAMIETAHEARPDSGYITDSLGWVLFKLGEPEEALPYMERAAELMPDDPIVNDHLGDVYWAVGREREAEFQWRRALSFDPEPDEAERIRRKLDIGLDMVLDEEGESPAWREADSGG